MAFGKASSVFQNATLFILQVVSAIFESLHFSIDFRNSLSNIVKAFLVFDCNCVGLSLLYLYYPVFLLIDTLYISIYLCFFRSFNNFLKFPSDFTLPLVDLFHSSFIFSTVIINIFLKIIVFSTCICIGMLLIFFILLFFLPSELTELSYWV